MKFIQLTCILFFLIGYTHLTAQQLPNGSLVLSDADLNHIEQAYWTAQNNKAITGHDILIHGEKFTKGIGTISGSSIFIFLDGSSNIFTAKVGLQDFKESPENLKFNALGDGTKLFYTENENQKQFVGIGQTEKSIEKGSVYFTIKGDGKQLWKSKKIKGGTTALPISLNIKGIQVLELVVTDAGDGVSGDHAVWAHPIISYTTFKPQIVDASYLGKIEVANSHFTKKIQPLINQLPKASTALKEGTTKDWLKEAVAITASVYTNENNKDITLSNGLISRTFRLSPNCATIDYRNLSTGESLIRGVRPEAMVTIDGTEYAVGGLDGQVEYGYLKNEWLDEMWSPVGSFQLTDFKISDIQERINWKNKRWAMAKKEPKKGKSIAFTYQHTAIKDVKITVHYNIYDGIPLLSKWFTIENNSEASIKLDRFKSEILAMVEAESSVERKKDVGLWELPNIHIESDYAFHSMSMKGANKVVHWEIDENYTSQANYARVTPCLLECKPPLGPNETIEQGKIFESFRVWELPFDSYDKQRKGLSTNAMYKKIAPWVTENPLFLHLTTTDDAKVKAAIDQCEATGYEMVILSFGSGLNMEDTSAKNIAKFKALADYAHSKGIELGGYSLLSSRWISNEVDVINPETGKRGGTIHGSSPCLNSQWGIDYFSKLTNFFEKTGFDLLEHDGSYPGQLCASTVHVGHENVHDSQWKAWKRITDFYKWCNEKGISLNIPDWYYLSGSTKNGIGYREVNWSLPRERQLVLGRQNIYDGTFERLPSMSWTFVPLSEYHGGGAVATIEPLDTHLSTYEAHMIQNYGMGIQACYRGPRLYDTERTKNTVIEVVNWYNKYRPIMNSPIVHLNRANGRDLDGMMHVNPNLKEKGLLQFFNPTNKTITKTIHLPLYYTGLTETATIREKEGMPKNYTLVRDYTVPLIVSVPANSNTWYVIE